MVQPMKRLFIENCDSLFYQQRAIKTRLTDIMAELKTMLRESEYVANQVYTIKNTVAAYPELFEGFSSTLERLDQTEKAVDDVRKTLVNHTMTAFEPR